MSERLLRLSEILNKSAAGEKNALMHDYSKSNRINSSKNSLCRKIYYLDFGSKESQKLFEKNPYLINLKWFHFRWNKKIRFDFSNPNLEKHKFYLK